MQTPIRVIVADDHPIFRKGLVDVIAADPRFVVDSEACDGEAALALVLQLKPRIVVADIDMPKLNGLGLAEKLRMILPSLDVIVLTSYKEESLFNRALDLGVKGYVLKDNAVTDLLRALHSVADGQAFFSPSISSFLVNRIRRSEALHSENPTLDRLTPTELRVLRLVADNQTSREIGKQLFISPRTVDTHRNSICTKLNLHGQRGLLVFALARKAELQQLKFIPSRGNL